MENNALQAVKIYLKNIDNTYSLGFKYVYNNKMYGKVVKFDHEPTTHEIVNCLNKLFKQQIKVHNIIYGEEEI